MPERGFTPRCYPKAREASVAEAGFALVADSQDENDLAEGIENVERHVSRRSPRNHELALLTLDSAADQRVRGQDANAIDDFPERCIRVIRRDIAKELPESCEILDGLGRMDYSRHLVGLGRGGFFPAAFARSQFTTSSCA